MRRPSAIIASSRCSTETYSSFRRPASRSARVEQLVERRDTHSCPGAAPGPLAVGGPRDAPRGPRAARRCLCPSVSGAGDERLGLLEQRQQQVLESVSAWPERRASAWAVVSASWLFWVSRFGSITLLVRVAAALELVDAVEELEHEHGTGEVEAEVAPQAQRAGEARGGGPRPQVAPGGMRGSRSPSAARRRDERGVGAHGPRQLGPG